jgi:WS/DGAT/MGAT family acyltransferase
VEAPGGQAELEALAGRIVTGLMDRTRPLWDIHVVDGLSGGQGALIVRVHHALADGIAGIALMQIMLDPAPAGSRATSKPRFQPKPMADSTLSIADAVTSAVHSSLESIISMEAVLLDLARALMDDQTKEALQKLARILPELGASSERFVFNKPCKGARKFCWTDFPQAEAEAVREAAGGTLNDVILTAVTQAVSRYIQLHGEAAAGRFLRIVCPVNVRRDNHAESLGNRITFLPVALPLGIDDPVRMLQAVSERTGIMKHSHAAHLMALLAAWIGAAPPPLQALFWDTIPLLHLPVPLLNMICTNVMGSPTPLYAAGRKMIACYPHVPTGYELGVNCAIQSYAGKLCCGFTADAGVVPDVEQLRDFVHAAFRDLALAASPRPAKKRSRPRRRKPSPAAPLNGVHAPPIHLADPSPADSRSGRRVM